MIRTYSEASKPATINEIKEKIESSIIPRFNEFDTKLSQIENKLAEQTIIITAVIKANIESALKYNNIKICYLIIDAVKACLPNCQIKKEQVAVIAKAFKRHELGSVDQNDLLSHALGQKNQTTPWIL